MLVLFHEDLDGNSAASVVYSTNRNCKLVEMDYSKSVPFNLIKKNEEVVIVDFSLQKPEDWETLRKITPYATWIDHHESAIKNSPDWTKELPGLRDTKACGAMLTWRYYYPIADPPEALVLIDLWDRWAHNENPKVLNFAAGMEAENMYPNNEKLWGSLLPTWNLYSNIDAPLIKQIQDNGEIIRKYEIQKNMKRVGKLAYEVEFEGHNCIAINVALTGRKVFESLDKKYDIYICHYYDSRQHTVSLYSGKLKKVNDIAEKYGGGGHPGASGFQCKELPWIKDGK